MNEYIELIDEIPGIGRRSAERIIAETGIEMKQSPFEIHVGGMCTLSNTP